MLTGARREPPSGNGSWRGIGPQLVPIWPENSAQSWQKMSTNASHSSESSSEIVYRRHRILRAMESEHDIYPSLRLLVSDDPSLAVAAEEAGQLNTARRLWCGCCWTTVPVDASSQHRVPKGGLE